MGLPQGFHVVLDGAVMGLLCGFYGPSMWGCMGMLICRLYWGGGGGVVPLCEDVVFSLAKRACSCSIED